MVIQFDFGFAIFKPWLHPQLPLYNMETHLQAPPMALYLWDVLQKFAHKHFRQARVRGVLEQLINTVACFRNHSSSLGEVGMTETYFQHFQAQLIEPDLDLSSPKAQRVANRTSALKSLSICDKLT